MGSDLGMLSGLGPSESNPVDALRYESQGYKIIHDPALIEDLNQATGLKLNDVSGLSDNVIRFLLTQHNLLVRALTKIEILESEIESLKYSNTQEGKLSKLQEALQESPNGFLKISDVKSIAGLDHNEQAKRLMKKLCESDPNYYKMFKHNNRWIIERKM